MRYKLSIALIIIVTWSFGQSLDGFTGLKSSGIIPSDFTTLSSQKYKEDFKENTDDKLDKEFYISTRFFIDELLHSGKVLFNDPISNYVSQVAKVILKEEEAIYNSLRFYTIKSTAVNAFSTDQGIIFITTGLIARLENEAQLAFVLAHEITHYTEKHVRDTYIKRELLSSTTGKYTRESYENAIQQMSVYSQNNEFEADEKGTNLYLYTDYDVSEVMKTFNVLLHSDLPYQNIPIDHQCLNTKTMEIPSSYFPLYVPKIVVDTSYDDKGHSHPNINKRIERANSKLKGINSGKKKFIVSEDTFNYVRNLARFELINLNLSQRHYVEVLYDIYGLEKEFSTEFLDLSKVKALYGLVMYKNYNRFSEVTGSEINIQGESHKLHAFFNKLSKTQLNVIAYRYAYDLWLKHNKNESFEPYLKRLKTELAINSNLVPIELKSSAYNLNINEKDTLSVVDSLQDSVDVISKKIGDDFHLFALHDLVSSENLIDELIGIQKTRDSLELQDDKYKLYVAQKKHKNKIKGYGFDTLNIINPIYENYGLNRKKKDISSEQKKIELGKIYAGKYRNLDMNINLIDSKLLDSTNIEDYNNLSVVNDWMMEVISHSSLENKFNKPMEMITSTHDKMLIANLKNGSANYLFSGVFSFTMRHEFAENRFAQAMISSVYFSPIGLIDLLIIHNYFQYVAIEVNAETDQIELVKVHSVNLKGLKKTVKFYTYDVLHQLNLPE